ncbi:ABC transporter substrate-binding protein [Pseudomonas sp. HMWF032]|uniref:substrate-binding periplasmic protein n=1 Tax=Pseudomonas sp. HMWF032 TaxID=2056866 RepID=UPI002115AACA|nr:transporter substrate-binding domain-containing protein [Pseudomonas sp. HMWF032]
MTADPLVRIGTGDWAPYVDQQRSDGGALSRLIRGIFEAAGYQVELVYYPWDRNLLMLEQGNLDAVMPYICNKNRQRFSQCSDAVAHGEVVLFQRADQQLNWQRFEDLEKFRIATTLGYSYGSKFDAALDAGRLQVQQSGKEDTGFRLLSLGRVDFHPQDRAVGYAMLQRLFSAEERALIKHNPRILHAEPLHVLFRKDDARAQRLLEVFNAGLRRLVANGELATLQRALNAGNADQWQFTPESSVQ